MLKLRVYIFQHLKGKSLSFAHPKLEIVNWDTPHPIRNLLNFQAVDTIGYRLPRGASIAAFWAWG